MHFTFAGDQPRAARPGSAATGGKAPLLQGFACYLADATGRGALRCDHPDLQARQFVGLIQEPLLWPRITRSPIPDSIGHEEVIGSAVDVFLAAYGTESPAGARR